MRLKYVALTAVATLGIAACGGDDDDATATPSSESTAAASETSAAAVTTEASATSDAAATTTASGSSATTGSAAPASGEPIRIGFVNLEGGSRVSIPQFRIGAEAALAYANANMGGIGGHPIELVKCNTDGTPESSTACANQLVDADVPLVAMGVDASPDGIVNVLSGAGITYVTNTGNSPVELTTPGAYAFTAGVPSSLAGYASFAESQGFDKLALLVIDNPSATQPVDELGDAIFANAGVELEVIKIPPGTPDMSSQVATAVSGGADIIGTLADPAFCLSFFSAYEAVGVTIPALLGNSCLRADVLAEAPESMLEHAYAAQKLQLDDDGEEGQLYREIIAEYGAGEDPGNPNLAGGYATIMGLARLLHDYEGPYTSEALADAIAAATAPYPMAPGVEIACTGTAIASLPNACSATEFIYQVTPDRQLQLVDTLDVRPLFS